VTGRRTPDPAVTPGPLEPPGPDRAGPALADPDRAGPATTPGGPVDALARDRTRLARGGALNLAGSLVNAVGGVVLVVIITRNLGPGGSGAFFEATALFQVVATAGQLGADTGLGRFIPRSLVHHRPSQIWTWTRLALGPVALVGLVSGTVIYLTAEPLGRLVAKGDHRDEFVAYVRIFAPFVAVGAVYFAIQTGSRAFGTMRPSVVIERLVRPIAQPLAMLAVFVLGMGPVAVAWAWIGPYAAAAVALGYWYVRQIRRAERRASAAGRTDEPRPPDDPTTATTTITTVVATTDATTADVTSTAADTAGPSPETTSEARAFWRFSAPRAVASLFQVAVRWLDVLLVGALASTREAGIYSAASRWLIGGTFVVFAINQAFQPQISAMMARAEGGRSRALFQSATAWAVALVWPLYLTLAVFGPVLVRVFGRGFGEGADALVILAIGGMTGAACGPVDMVLLMGGRSSATMLSAAIGLTVNIGVNVALVPRYGFVGAAVAWSATIATTNLIGVWQIRRLVGRAGYGSIWLRAMVAAIGGAGAPLLVARLALGATPLAMVVGLATGAVGYALVLRRWQDLIPMEILRGVRKGRSGRVA
jgi:O-antigen/teichoic acid export membrane protein